MNYQLDWNKPGSFSAGRDPLGLQAASVRLYTDLLPGLTNVTNRLRYFSFYCWVVRQFELRRHTFDEQKWSIFIRRVEAIYALACQIGDSGTALGMAGSVWAGAHSSLEDSFDFTPWTDRPGQDGQYLKAAWGNFGQFYVRSMQQMHMLEESSHRIQAVTPDYGQELADAFEQACPNACRLMLAAIDTGTIERSACLAISDEAHPTYLEPASDEAQVLVRYLCGDRKSDPTASDRRATLWNVLNIVENTRVSDATALRRELYVQDNVGASMVGPLAGNLLGWRAYFINEFCHIALEVLLNSLTHRINETSGCHADVAARELARSVLTGHSPAMSVAELAELSSIEALEHEHDRAGDLADLVRTAVAPKPEQLADAVPLILSLWRRWGADTDLDRLLIDATVGGRSARGVFRFLDEVAGRPAFDGLAALIRKFVISNHLLIAGQKLASAGTYTYRFIVDEDGLVDGVPAEYGFTNPRLGNLLVFARDARLVDDSGVTEAGKAFLRADQPL
ncbi:MAG: hypothetical protein WDN44_09120 [Sphingomonas sp.]